MIAVRPGKLAYDVLRLIVESPGEYTVDALVRELHLTQAPPRPVLGPPVGGVSTGMTAWRARVEAHNAAYAAWEEARRLEHAAQREKMARLVGRLQEAGLVERIAPPALSPEFANAASPHGVEGALRRFSPRWPDRRPLVGEAAYLALIARAGTGYSSTKALLGPRPSGSTLRAYRDLVRWGVLVAPQQRHPTAAGVALIASPPLSVVA